MEKESKIKKFQEEILRKDKIIEALTERVESFLNNDGNSFDQFHDSVILAEIVNERTKHLNEMKNNLELERNKIREQNSELIKAKKELTSALDYNQTLVDSLQDCLIVVSKSGVIKNVNKRFCEIFEVLKGNVVGLFVTDFFQTGNEEDDFIRFQIEDILEGNHVNLREFGWHVQKDNCRFFALSSFGFESQKHDEIIITLRDISSRKEIELIMEKEKVKSLNSAKLASLGEMAGGIAHEINNPLAIISSTMRTIRKMVEKNMVNTADFSDALNDVDQTISRITKIVSGMRNISRNSSEDVFDACNITDILDDILPLCSEKLRSHEISLTVDISPTLLETTLEVMRVPLSQVILNLVTNASDELILKNDEKEKWIKITGEVSDRNKEMIIRIMDSGQGIPYEIQDKIFQPFFTTKDIGKGTGLGLSLSDSIIKRHCGKFYVDNNVPNTCFVIAVPIQKKRFRSVV